MLRLKNLGETVHAYFPAGHAESVEVAEGGLIEIRGEVVEELADAYVVNHGDGLVRAWPKARWQLEVTASRKLGAVKQDKDPVPAPAE